MNRRTFLGACGAAAAPASRPNVVLLYADDQRSDTIRALGNDEIQTPNLDRLAARGVSYDRTFVMGGTSGAVCIASRAMLLSGQRLFRAVAAVEDPAAPVTLLGETFRASGYSTFGIGKWHNPPARFSQCFEDGAAIFMGGMDDHAHTIIQDYDPSGRYPAARRRKAERFSSELFADEAVAFLKRQPPAKPFLLYTAFTAPHDPRMAPPEFARMYPPDRIRLPGNFMARHPFDNGELKVRDEALAAWPRSEAEVRGHIAAYYAMISHLDAQIGRILTALDETGRARDTVVVFAGDNGLALGQHGLMGKQSLYEHSVRVPLIISGPGVPQGVRRQQLAYLYDIFPTLCELTGIRPPAAVEGRSLAGGQRAAAREDLLLAYRHLQRALRDDQWKLIEYNVDGVRSTQLFDLSADPLELHNLAGQPLLRARQEQMRQRLRARMKEAGDPLAESFL